MQKLREKEGDEYAENIRVLTRQHMLNETNDEVMRIEMLDYFSSIALSLDLHHAREVHKTNQIQKRQSSGQQSLTKESTSFDFAMNTTAEMKK